MSFKGARAQGAGKDRWGRPKRSKKVPLGPHTLRPRASRASAVLGLGVGRGESGGHSPRLSAARGWVGRQDMNLDKVKEYAMVRNLVLS